LIAGGIDDHIHLLIEINKDVSVSEAVRLIKSNSSKWMHETFPGKEFGWQSGYGAFSVSKSVIPKVTEYIRNQEEHHRKMSYAEELKKFLDEYGFAYDKRYMWD
jgi:putative transposase